MMTRDEILDRLYDNVWRRRAYEKRLPFVANARETFDLKTKIMLAEMSFDDLKRRLSEIDADDAKAGSPESKPAPT